MERIQSAIAKARASRGGMDEDRPAPRPASPEARVQTPRAGNARPEDWAALPEVTLDRRVLRRNRIVALAGTAEATAFDIMRTRATQQMRPKGWTRLAITSPTSECGKSMVAANLALSLARQPETSVILFEMDMRRPNLARILGLDVRHSAAEILSGHGRVSDNAVRIGDNLMVATSHAPAPKPSDLLQGESVARVLAEIEAAFAPSIVIFDMPPLLVNDDAIAFLGHVDCALLIAAAGQTSVKEIDRCERELAAHTSVLGVALNKCRYMHDENRNEYY